MKAIAILWLKMRHRSDFIEIIYSVKGIVQSSETLLASSSQRTFSCHETFWTPVHKDKLDCLSATIYSTYRRSVTCYSDTVY